MNGSAPSAKQRNRRLVFGAGASLLVLLIAVLMSRLGTETPSPDLPRGPESSGDIVDPVTPVPVRENLAAVSVPQAELSPPRVPAHAIRVRVTGRVLADPSRQPIGGATVSLLHDPDPVNGAFRDESRATSNRDGSFELELWLSTHRVGVVAEHPEHLATSRVLRNDQVARDGLIAGFDLLLSERSTGAALRGILQGDRGRKLSRVEVELERWGVPTLEAPLRAATDDEGRFSFREVPPGRWALTARAPAYEDYVLAPMDLGPRSETDLGVLGLSSFPWARIAGTVRNERGEGIPGLRVGTSGIGAPLRTVHTGVEGEYLAERLAPGDVFVRVWVDNGFSLRKRVTLSAGEVRQLDFAMPEAGHFLGGVAYLGDEPASRWTASLSYPQELPDGSAATWTTELDEHGRFRIEGLPGPVELQFTREVPYSYEDVGLVAIDREDHVFRLPVTQASILQGTVRDPEGAPLADARVAPLLPSPEERAVTDTEGRYELRVSLSNDSTFPILAHKTGYISSSISTMENAADAGGIIRLDFVLYPDAWTGVVAGYIRDPQGRPIGGAECRIRLGSRGGGSGRTDSRGYFEIQGVLPGQLALHIRHDRFRDQRLDRELAPGARLDLDVQLEPWRVHTRQFEVYGEGNPLAGAEVSVASTSRGFMIVDGGTTDSQGRVTLTGVPEETVRVSVKHPDYPNQSMELMVEGELVTAVPFHLRRGSGRIEGIVHTASGVARQDVEISLTGPVTDGAGIWDLAYTDEEGRFRFTGLPSAEYTIMAWTIAGEIEQRARVNGPTVEFVVR